MASQPTQQYVVVWECLSQPNSSRWKAYTPSVSQILEKAFRSKLTQVLLGDADPTLSQYRVSMASMVQICELREEATPIRRMLYPRSSPAGQGIRWDWLGDRFSEWIEYEMDAQIAIESAWTSGLQTLDLSKNCSGMPYLINFCNLTQVRKDTGFVRSIRRVQQATYPAALKNETPPPEPPPLQVPNKPFPSDNKTCASSPAKGSNWLSGIINSVKSNKSNNSSSNNEPSRTPKPAKKSCPPTQQPVPTLDQPEQTTTTMTAAQQRAAKRESRLALRVERRAPRSSSLDTVSTCLSQDSLNNPQNRTGQRTNTTNNRVSRY